MIIDHLTHMHHYFQMNSRLMTAIRYLQETDFTAQQPERYEIDGNAVFALYQKVKTKPMGEGFWEAHRKYIDIHYMIKGAERIGYAHIHRMKPGVYDEEKDFQIFEGIGSFFLASVGMCVVMMPQDAHMPLVAVSAPKSIKKVVIKVAVQ